MVDTLNSIHDLIAEDGRDIVYDQARMSSGLVDLPMPSDKGHRSKPARKRMEKPISVKRMAQRVGTVQVKKGGHSAFGVTSDGAARRTGSSISLSKGTYEAKLIEGALVLPLAITKVAAGGEGVDFADENLRTLGRQYGQHLDRAVAGTRLAAPTSASGTDTNFDVADPSGYVEGETFDHYLANDTFVESFVVTNIAPPSASLNGDWTITVSANLGTTIGTDAKIYQSGGGTAANRLASLTDVCTAATQMYGLSTTAFPSGISVALSSWDNISGRKMGDLIAQQSGERPTHIVTSSLGKSKILNAQLANRRFNSGNVDPYGDVVAMFDELPIIVSEQLSPNTIRFINADACFLHEFWSFGFDNDGVTSGGVAPSGLKLSQTAQAYLGLGTAGVEFVVNHRRAFGEFTSVGDS